MMRARGTGPPVAMGGWWTRELLAPCTRTLLGPVCRGFGVGAGGVWGPAVRGAAGWCAEGACDDADLPGAPVCSVGRS